LASIIKKRVSTLFDFLAQASTARLLVFFLFLGLLVYGRVLFYPFVHDDAFFIHAFRNHPELLRWDSLKAIFLDPQTPAGMLPYYRPLLTLFYKGQYTVFGNQPFFYHLFNLTVHITNTLLVYSIFIFLKSSRLGAAAVATFFLIHPVQTQAVTCIAGVSNILFSLLCFASFRLYLGHLKGEGKKALLYFVLSLVLFTLSLFVKEQAILFAFLILLLEVCLPLRPLEALQNKIIRFLGFLTVAGGYLSFRNLILGGIAGPSLGPAGELGLRLFSIPKTILTYFKILVFPSGLHYYRTVDILQPFLRPILMLFAVAVLVVVLLSFFSPQERRLAVFGIGWFFLSLLPVLNIAPLIVEYSFVMTSEHFLYFPLFGFLIFISQLWLWGSRVFFKDKSEIKTKGFLIFLAVIFVLLSIRQNTYWRGDVPLFERTLRFERQLGRIHILLGKAYFLNGKTDEAMVEYETALSIMRGYLLNIRPEAVRRFYLGYIKESHFDLAHCYESKDDYKGAAEEYRAAIRIDPADSVLYNNLGTVYLKENKTSEAAGIFKEALRLNPHDVMAMNNLALCYINEGKLKEAKILLEGALSLDTNFTQAKQNLKKLLQGKDNN